MTSSISKTTAILILAFAGAALAGCGSTGSGQGEWQMGPPQQPYMTRERAASECWMATEKGRADINLDKRADIVTKCIDDKLKKAKSAPAG